MLQLIGRDTTRDYDAWKAAFDDDNDRQRKAGLGLLQLWRQADAPGEVWFLFRVNDRDRAQAYLDDPISDQIAERAGVTGAERHFVETQ